MNKVHIALRCSVYLDDVIIYSSSFDKHLQDIGRMPQQPWQGQVSRNGKRAVAKDIDKIRDIINYTSPYNVTQLNSFLAIANYYNKNTSNFAQISAPLNGLLKKNAFVKLKEQFTNPSTLIFLDFQLPFDLHVDASCSRVGCVLVQKIDNQEKVIVHVGKSLNSTLAKYSVKQLKLLALIFYLQTLDNFQVGEVTSKGGLICNSLRQ